MVFFSFFVFLKKQGGAQGERILSSVEPDAGLDLTTLKSRPEPKSRVTRFTHSALKCPSHSGLYTFQSTVITAGVWGRCPLWTPTTYESGWCFLFGAFYFAIDKGTICPEFT